jgi:hypothetical protein
MAAVDLATARRLADRVLRGELQRHDTLLAAKLLSEFFVQTIGPERFARMLSAVLLAFQNELARPAGPELAKAVVDHEPEDPRS